MGRKRSSRSTLAITSTEMKLMAAAIIGLSVGCRLFSPLAFLPSAARTGQGIPAKGGTPCPPPAYFRMARKPLATTKSAVPTSAKTAIHMVACPVKVRAKNRALTPSASVMFWTRMV